MSRTVIHGGLVITTSDEIHADVLVEGGRIAALDAHGTDAAESWSANRRIDATGKYVIPGGVDGHTHMEMPFGGTYAADTFETGTRAAAWYAKADGNCAFDYAFHTILADVNPSSLKEMDLLVSEGVTSFKGLVRSRDQGFSSGVGRVPCEVAA